MSARLQGRAGHRTLLANTLLLLLCCKFVGKRKSFEGERERLTTTRDIAYTRRRRIKGAKMEDKSQIQSKNTNTNENEKTNGTENDDEPDFLHVVVPNSSSDSQNDGEDEDEVAQVEDSYEDDDNDDDEEAKSNEITNQRRNNAKNGDDEGEKEDSTKIKSTNETAASSHCFPIHRISRIIRSEDPDIRIAQESVFLINKASEKFLELFCKEAYGCAFLDHKKHVEYKHMSSVVSKRRRFDFLSDFVPEKAKAKSES